VAKRDHPDVDVAERLRAGERVMVRLSPESANTVVGMAETERRTISQMVRVLIEEAVEARQRSRI